MIFRAVAGLLGEVAHGQDLVVTVAQVADALRAPTRIASAAAHPAADLPHLEPWQQHLWLLRQSLHSSKNQPRDCRLMPDLQQQAQPTRRCRANAAAGVADATAEELPLPRPLRPTRAPIVCRAQPSSPLAPWLSQPSPLPLGWRYGFSQLQQLSHSINARKPGVVAWRSPGIRLTDRA